MSNLQTTLAEIKKILPVAQTDPSPEPYETLTARRGRQARAKETLKQLRETYRRDLLNSAVFIVVTGENSGEFRELANTTGSFRADPETLYQRLIEDIPTSLFGREGPGSLFDMVTRRLEDAALDLGVVEMPQLIFKKEYDRKVNSREEFLQMIKKAINTQVGSELVGLQTIADLVDLAIDKGHKNKDTPVVLATNDSALAVELDRGLQRLTRRVYLVTAGAVEASGTDFHVPEVTQESVNKVMKTIKASLKR
jgi:hypothetical protein